MILREDTTDKSYEFIRILNRKSGNINEADFVVQLIHVLGAFV